MFDLAKVIDEKVGGGTGAHTDDAELDMTAMAAMAVAFFISSCVMDVRS